jgi:transcriptional regulator with XRE-family HTH domain
MKNAPREKAVALRRKGLSYNEIRKKIDVSKSTLSLWLKGIRLRPEYRRRLYTKQIEILSRGATSQKERRSREVDAIIETSMRETSFPISEEAYKLFGVALYWAEGSKPRLNIYSQQDENDIKNFWSDLTGIPMTNFGKTYIKPANRGA